jgi:cyclic dehypoxanthinyl futalosine synthase
LLLQGGHHPELGFGFLYNHLSCDLNRNIQPLNYIRLGPPELHIFVSLEKKSHHEVLKALKEAGMDSLPGAGARDIGGQGATTDLKRKMRCR